MNGLSCRLRRIITMNWVFIVLSVVVVSAAAAKGVRELSTVTQVSSNPNLRTDFYNSTCPNVENIVLSVMQQRYSQSPPVAAGVLRIFNHDCFVQGCDASIILVSTPGNVAEKDADINLSLSGDGFDAIVKAKTAVEAQCPGVVSCADILAIAARDLVGLAGGPFWEVLLGRRDGRISQASQVPGNIPTPDMSIDQIMQIFFSKGLSRRDLVTLDGAHTIGFAHCVSFNHRLYNFSSTQPVDPTLNPQLAQTLKQTCPPVNFDPNVVTFLDQTTPFTFDNLHYQNAQKGLSVLSSDEQMFHDSRTHSIVNHFASDEEAFFSAFVNAITNMGNIGVKTGSEGEIRKDCAFVNSN